jgi:hypothetical protein
MLLITTTKCHDYGHPELTLALDSTGVRLQARFQPGQSLQIGWGVVWFVALPNKTLGFEEPDMKSMPLVRQPGLTNSLRHLRLHKDTLESVLCSDALSPIAPAKLSHLHAFGMLEFIFYGSPPAAMRRLGVVHWMPSRRA